MTIKALATTPVAFVFGAAGVLAQRAFYGWSRSRQIELTTLAEIAAYAGFIFVPFLTSVIGWEPKRWDPGYNWFSEEEKAASKQRWIRCGAFWLGAICIEAIALLI
jgi:hypothetical protein